jgi:hypothetical protein
MENIRERTEAAMAATENVHEQALPAPTTEAGRPVDNAGLAVTGTVADPVRHPWRARVRVVPVPAAATLLHGSVHRPELSDAFALRVPPGTTTDPQDWADAIFRDPPRVVVALLHLRNRLVTPLGIEPGDASAFDTLSRTDREVLLGTDARHLNFRAGVLVEPDVDGTTITVATLAATRSRAGRAYLAVVRLVHPLVVRAMLRHAGRATVARGAPHRHRRADRFRRSH